MTATSTLRHCTGLAPDTALRRTVFRRRLAQASGSPQTNPGPATSRKRRKPAAGGFPPNDQPEPPAVRACFAQHRLCAGFTAPPASWAALRHAQAASGMPEAPCAAGAYPTPWNKPDP